MSTGISTAGDFVTTGLTTERANRVEENDAFQYPIGIASTAVDEFQVVAKQLDLELLQEIGGRIDIINRQKEEIIGLGQSALGAFTPGFIPPICSFYSEVPPNDISSGEDGTIAAGGTITPAVGYSVIRTDNIRIRRYPNLEARISPDDNALENMRFPILTNSNSGQGEESLYVANSRYTDPELPDITYYIYNNRGDWNLTGFEGEQGDTLGRYYAINPAGVSTTTYDIPGSLSFGDIFNPAGGYAAAINSSNFFVGVETGCTWTSVGSTENPSVSFSTDWNTQTGQLSGGGGGEGPGTLTVPVGVECSDLAAKQAALLVGIGSERIGLSTYFVSTNTAKIRKHANQLKLWSIKRVDTRNREESFGTNNFPRDITTTIPTVESIEPQLPTNRNTADATRGDLNADSTQFTADSY